MRLKSRNTRTWLILAGIILLALALRGAFFVKNIDSFRLGGDARNYFLMSHQLVDKGIYGYWYEGLSYGGQPGISNARVTPGYPLFVSSVYAVVRDPYLQISVIRLLQVLIGGLITPLLAFLFVRRLLKRSDAALITAFIVAVYPTYIQSVTLLLTEVLALASMLLYFYLMTAAFEKRKGWLAILAGAAFALQICIRPAMLPLFPVPFIFAFIEWKKEDRSGLVKLFMQTLAGFAIIMLPWWVRNIVVLHQLIITGGGSGNPLLAGTYPYLMPGMPGFMNDVPESYKGVSELQSKLAVERIIRGFNTEPLLYLKWFTIGKLQFLFGKPWLLYNPEGLMGKLHLLMHTLLVWGGLLGTAVNSMKKRTHLYMGIYAALFTCLYLIFIPENRYVYQIMFFLMVAFAALVCRAWDGIRGLYIGKNGKHAV